MKALRIAAENHVFALFQRDCNGILLKRLNIDETLKVGYGRRYQRRSLAAHAGLRSLEAGGCCELLRPKSLILSQPSEKPAYRCGFFHSVFVNRTQGAASDDA